MENDVIIKNIEENMKYILPSENPLSANVIIVEGKENIWLYDVGNNDKIPDIIRNMNTEEKNINVVLSHFHPDHTGNINKIQCGNIYLGKNTFKYIKSGIVVDDELNITDGDIKIKILPVWSSHAKGSVLMEVNEKYCFLGDCVYPASKGNESVYNAGVLLEEIKTLKKIKAPLFLVSHREPFVEKKEDVIGRLEKIYEKRQKGQQYIVL